MQTSAETDTAAGADQHRCRLIARPVIVSLVGGYPYAAGHDRHADRLRPLLHRRPRPHRPTPGLRRTRRRRRPDLPGQGTDRHQPPPGPASTRPSQAVRAGDTLVVPELDRLARSVPDARDIGDSLVDRGVRLSLGGTICDPTDPLGKMFFQHPRHLRRVRGRPTPATHPRRDGRRPREGQAARQAAEAHHPAATRAGTDAQHRRVLQGRPRRAVHRLPSHRAPGPRTPPQPDQARNSNRCFCAGSYGDP